jgi:hypothetical protein
MTLLYSKKNKKINQRKRKTERQRMLVHVLSKTGGSKMTYLFRVKLGVQKNEEDKKYESARHTDICKSK